MDTKKLDFNHPKGLIADRPASPRDAAKLLILDKRSGQIKHIKFSEIDQFLVPGDVLVLNETKVFAARCFGRKDTGGKVEVVFLSEEKPKVWEVLIGDKMQIGQKINFSKNFSGIVVERKKDSWMLAVDLSEKNVYKKLEKLGEMPLPPYIKRKAERKDKKDYQTVFAQKIGSAAAPTAGLHFTKRLIKKLEKKGVQIEYITLHVGLGTFAPIKTNKVEEHPIHSEYYEISREASQRLNQAKKEGRRIIACGTTVVRTLESVASACHPGLARSELVESDPGSILKKDSRWRLSRATIRGGNDNYYIKSGKGQTNLFIYPGYKFKIVDGMITNFHTPRSSLLALVYAFAGEENIKKAYAEAIKKKYRFYSYGDGMLII